MQHFKNIAAMIRDLEGEAHRYERAEKQNEQDGEKRAALTSRVYASALRNTVIFLKECYIGPSAHDAKPLEQCE